MRGDVELDWPIGWRDRQVNTVDVSDRSDGYEKCKRMVQV